LLPAVISTTGEPASRKNPPQNRLRHFSHSFKNGYRSLNGVFKIRHIVSIQETKEAQLQKTILSFPLKSLYKADLSSSVPAKSVFLEIQVS
jgi:hypothetical protein